MRTGVDIVMEIYEHYTNDFFEIEYKRLGKKFVMPMLHYHNAYEIMIMEKGEREILYENKIYNLSAHDVIMFRPNAVHRNAGGTPFARLVIYFTDKYMGLYFSETAKKQLLSCFENECVSLSEEEYVQVARCTRLMFEERDSGGGYEYIYLSELLKILNGAKIYSSDQKKYGKNLMLIRVMEYIDKNYQAIEGISEIADDLHITKQYLCRLVKRGTGLTVTQYINSVRIRRACEMILRGDKTVTEICYECGFNSSTYFCKIFKRIMNMTPTQYSER